MHDVDGNKRIIALKLALGATSLRVAGTMFAKWAIWSASGVILGAVTSAFVGGALSQLLFDAPKWNPLALLRPAAEILCVVSLVCWIIIWKACNVDYSILHQNVR